MCPSRVLISTNWPALGKSVNHCSWTCCRSDLTLPGFAAFLSWELKPNLGPNVISGLTKSLTLWLRDPNRLEALFLRLVNAGWNLIKLNASESGMWLFSGSLVPSLRGSTTWPKTCQGRKGQAGRLNHMTSNMQGRKGYPRNQIPAHFSPLQSTQGFPPSWPSGPGLWALLGSCPSKCLLCQNDNTCNY